MTNVKQKASYVKCLRCGQIVRSGKFERHALNHWLMSTTVKSFREFFNEIKGPTVTEAPAS